MALRVAIALWVLGGLLFVAMAVPFARHEVQELDDAVYRLALSAEQPVMVGFARILDFIGSTPVTAPLIVLVALFLLWRRRWEALIFWVLAMAASQALIGPIKNLYERPRPPDSLVETSSWSFPSGHAVAGAAIAVALVIVLVRAGPRRRNLELLAVGFAFAMAMSRVYLRAHWLSDVGAGAALGVAVALTAAAVVHIVHDALSAEPNDLMSGA